ncbi:MAG TPA: response regulator transcription factor [Thermoanaerobaculia bacterium]|nr:response regulator transcription factor [Thermoanaerobaculia bacterium]
MRIVVADDHQIIRRGLQLIVARRPDWLIAAEAEEVPQLLDLIRHDGYDVLVMGLRLRGRSTLEVLEQIRREHIPLPALILTSYPEEQYAVAALRAGARGYLKKDATADEILDAIARVAAGRTYVSERITELLAQGLASSSVAPHERLSGRELEVFLRLARGETVGDIAAALGVSIKTVSTYRTRILEKTGFRSNADIVTYAVRNDLLT